MASRLWLAVLLFQLATAAPTPAEGSVEARDLEAANAPVPRDTIIERDDEDWSRYGTNKNSPLIGEPARESRAGVDYVKALLDPTKQPALFKPYGDCVYSYEHQAKSGQLTLWESGTSPIVDVNVAQGGIGDCGFGASIGALALGGHSQYLKDRVKVNGTTWEFKFTYKGEDHIVRVDDQLPYRLPTAGQNCNNFLGYQPAGPAKSWYVPLVEKATAKLFDAYPNLRTYPDRPGGYNGLQGVYPDIALELLTGKKGKHTYRKNLGLKDEALVAALEKCLTSPEPCVVGTPDVADGNYWLGSAQFRNGGWEVPAFEDYVAAFFSESESHKTLWDSVDHDLNEAHNTIVSTHAWALDTRNTNYKPGDDLRKVKVRILNPWGVNPTPWQKVDARNGVDISLSALAGFIDGIWTVESI